MNADFFSFVLKDKTSYLCPRPKIQKKPYLDTSAAQIVKQLSFVRRIQGPTCFQLQKHNSVYHEIGFVGAYFLTTEQNR